MGKQHKEIYGNARNWMIGLRARTRYLAMSGTLRKGRDGVWKARAAGFHGEVNVIVSALLYVNLGVSIHSYDIT